MLYPFYDMYYQMLTPLNKTSDVMKDALKKSIGYEVNPALKMSKASVDMFERLTKLAKKPDFGIDKTYINGKEYKVIEEHFLEKPFSRLKHFKVKTKVKRPNLYVCAPLSGHYATLLRSTVAELLPYGDVYISDWSNARDVPLSDGDFGFDECVEHIIDHIKYFKGNCHVLAVCQPSVTVLSAVSLLASENSKSQPKSMILMNGPVDVSKGKTQINEFTQTMPIEWFRYNVISTVPWWYAGANREVYPGFMQLAGFISMNPVRHFNSHMNYFNNLIEGRAKQVLKHRNFYDNYTAVMDLPAEFYLDTIERIFQKNQLATGKLKVKGKLVDPSKITKTALLTIEGELDDISGIGQTKAAHNLCTNLPRAMHQYHLQKDAGHFGVFNGEKYKKFVRPIITDFINKFE